MEIYRGNADWLSLLYKFGRFFGAHDARHAVDAQYISLFMPPLHDELQGARLHEDTTFGDGFALGDVFGADIHHMRVAACVKMREITAHDSFVQSARRIQ